MTKNEHPQPSEKKSNVLRNTIIGSVTMVIVALASSPGFFAWLEGAGKKAEASGKKADMAYELMRQQMEYIAKGMDTQQQDIRELRSMFMSMRSEQSQMKAEEEVRPRGRHAPVVSPVPAPEPTPAKLERPEDLFGQRLKKMPTNLEEAMQQKEE